MPALFIDIKLDG